MSPKSLMIALGLALAACTGERGPLGSEKNPVKFYLLPSVDAKMLADGAKVLKAFLEKNTPYKYETAVPASYVAVVEAFGTKRVDVASINTFGYLMAHEKYGTQALVTVIRNGLDTYQAQIVARADANISKLEDFAGKKFAYVDPASTSGYLLPAKLFAEKGIKPSETVFAKKHDNVIMMVYQKQVDGGATFYSAPDSEGIQDARRLVKTQFPDVEKTIKIVTLTDAIPNDPIAFRKDMPEEMKQKIVAALLDFVKTDEGKVVFKGLYGVTELKQTTDASYDGVRSMLKSLGKNAEELAKGK
jgi:phosphonate transport system substrate-binding protein